MKILFLVAIIIILFVIFRRIGRDTTVTMPKFWEQRPPLAFDDFYTQYYADSGIEKDSVRAILNQLSRILRVPADRLRPEDRLDDLRPGATERAGDVLRNFSQSPLIPQTIREPMSSADLHIETVDDFIRKISQLGEHIEGDEA